MCRGARPRAPDYDYKYITGGRGRPPLQMCHLSFHCNPWDVEDALPYKA